MNYAPVIIPTLCRYEHFIRCLESLRKNTWAKYTDVYIALDYPLKESHRNGYEKIKNYLKQKFDEFNSFNVFAREKNYGAYKNTQEIKKYCFSKYDRYIYIEDDIECSANFLQYMNLALERYKDDDSVIAVSGYQAPVNLKFQDKTTAVKQNLQATTWGIGTWNSKIIKIEKQLSSSILEKRFAETYLSGKIFQMTDWAIHDYIGMVCHGVSHNSMLKQITDIALRILLTVDNKYIIMPTISKTRNLGFDGSGLYCPQINVSEDSDFTSISFDYSHQLIDENEDFELFVDEQLDNDGNRKVYNQYDVVSSEDMNELLKNADMYCRHSKIWRKAQNIKLLANSALGKIKK